MQYEARRSISIEHLDIHLDIKLTAHNLYASLQVYNKNHHAKGDNPHFDRHFNLDDHCDSSAAD
jgi:hypothetical protein